MLTEFNPESDSWIEIERIYTEAFPPEELRPVEDLRRRAESHDNPLRLLIVRDDRNEIAGLITCWCFPGFTYVEHFAVDNSLRGRGIGSNAMREFLSSLSVPAVLEVEPCGLNEMAARRIAFYEKLGLGIIDYDYVQPPYAPGLPEVRLKLMSTDPAKTHPSEIEKILHREVYGVGRIE